MPAYNPRFNGPLRGDSGRRMGGSVTAGEMIRKSKYGPRGTPTALPGYDVTVRANRPRVPNASAFSAESRMQEVREEFRWVFRHFGEARQDAAQRLSVREQYQW